MQEIFVRTAEESPFRLALQSISWYHSCVPLFHLIRLFQYCAVPCSTQRSASLWHLKNSQAFYLNLDCHCNNKNDWMPYSKCTYTVLSKKSVHIQLNRQIDGKQKSNLSLTNWFNMMCSFKNCHFLSCGNYNSYFDRQYFNGWNTRQFGDQIATPWFF